jgi:hypothetical protein
MVRYNEIKRYDNEEIIGEIQRSKMIRKLICWTYWEYCLDVEVEDVEGVDDDAVDLTRD